MSDNVNDSDISSVITVLYVEDNPANIKLMQDIFDEFLSYKLLCATNAEEGIELAKQTIPNLMLMDINMGGMNGYQALEIIKNDAAIAAIPVIAISADAMPHQIEEGLAKGFVDYWPKPFNIVELIKSLKNRLEP